MKIVIDIPENMDLRNYDIPYDILNIITSGVPLPEYHGDLIDRNKLVPYCKFKGDCWADKCDSCSSYAVDYLDIKDAPAIIKGSDSKINLDEAIDHCEELAEELEKRSSIHCDSMEDTMKAEECRVRAAYHRQLAEWLRELKVYRIAHYKLRDMDYEYDFNSKFGDNPMYYGEKVWDLFGDIDEHQDEVMGYEEVKADDRVSN